MSRTRNTSWLAGLLAAAVVAGPAFAAPPELLRLRANALDLNNRARTEMLDIVVERWSTPDEVARLKAILIEKGPDRLLDALQDVKPRCGWVRTSTSLAWDIYFAVETPLPDGGRRIVLASDRPVGYWEAANSTRSRDYEFSLAEIRIPAGGEGEGKAIKAAKVTFDKEENTLEIENFQREPVRLVKVSVVPGREK